MHHHKLSAIYRFCAMEVSYSEIGRSFKWIYLWCMKLTTAGGKSDSVSYISRIALTPINHTSLESCHQEALLMHTVPSLFHVTRSGPETSAVKPEKARKQSKHHHLAPYSYMQNILPLCCITQ